MRVAIWTNIYKDENLSCTAELMGILKEAGIEYFVDERHEMLDSPTIDFSRLGRDIDIMIVLGGDGTILSVAKKCASVGMPILGINLGSMGFLSELERHEMHLALDALRNGSYRVEHRSMLTVHVGDFHANALNEIVVGRQSVGKMAKIIVRANGELIDRYNCDGLIVSTPTGSTAYSLAAGGPIISPSTDVMCLTPVSPHSLHSRPIVINDSERLSIRLAENRGKGQLYIDGTASVSFEYNEEIRVRKSKKTARFIRIKETTFYQKLLKKLNMWSTTEE